MLRRQFLVSAIVSMLLPAFIGAAFAQTDPLPSWNDGAVKKSITDFVAKVTAQARGFRARRPAHRHLRQ